MPSSTSRSPQSSFQPRSPNNSQLNSTYVQSACLLGKTYQLPPQLRPLASTDYHRGHLAVLSVLTVVTDPGEDAWRAQFEAVRAAPRTYYPIVIVDKPSDRIVAVGTVFVERKFLRGLGCVGHIEDIAVDKSQQGKKLGLRIIHALTAISENSGCYKTILNCSDSNIRKSRSSHTRSR